MTASQNVRARRFAFAALLAGCSFSAPLFAQEGGATSPDPEELMRQIRRNLVKIEDDLQKVKVESADAAGAAVQKDIEKLVETMRRRQAQVTKDIDEVIDQMKKQGGGGSGDCDNPSESDSKSKSKPSPQSKGKSKDRNQSESGQKKPDGGQPKDESGKPDSKDGGKKDQAANQKPKDGKKPDGKPGEGEPEGGDKKGGAQENRVGADPKNPQGRKVVPVQINEIWGRLPPEQRQKLVDRNFDDFTPEYEAEIREYLRRTNSIDK